MDISIKMQNVIEEQLKEIEEKENVKIIYCVESEVGRVDLRHRTVIMMCDLFISEGQRII